MQEDDKKNSDQNKSEINTEPLQKIYDCLKEPRKDANPEPRKNTNSKSRDDINQAIIIGQLIGVVVLGFILYSALCKHNDSRLALFESKLDSKFTGIDIKFIRLGGKLDLAEMSV